MYNKPLLIEQWKIIDDSVVPGATGDIAISTFGRLYSISRQTFIEPSLNHDGYLVFNLPLTNGKRKYSLVHRTVMLAFCPIPEPDKYEVNHNDGNKQNPHIWNLVWSTHVDNVRYALLNRQRVAYDNNANMNTLLDDYQLNQIGQLLSDNVMTKQEIANKFGCSTQIISHIANGTVYKFIYEKYNLGLVRKTRTMNRLSAEQIEQIKQIMYNNPPVYTSTNDLYRQLLNQVGFEYDVWNKALERYMKRLFERENIRLTFND